MRIFIVFLYFTIYDLHSVSFALSNSSKNEGDLLIKKIK